MKSDSTTLLRAPEFTTWAGPIPVLIAFTSRLAVRSIEKVRDHHVRRMTGIESVALSDHTLADLGISRTSVAAMGAGARKRDTFVPRRNLLD